MNKNTNRSPLQVLEHLGALRASVTSPAIRNGLREAITKIGLPMNRRRENNEDQLAVSYVEFINADKYADDHLFGNLSIDP